MSLLPSAHLCASDEREGCCCHRLMFNTPAGHRDPGRVGHGTMDGARGAEDRQSHDDLEGADRKPESVASQNSRFPRLVSACPVLPYRRSNSSTKRLCSAEARSGCRISPLAPKSRETMRHVRLAVSAPI
jgi:hypothetical protein